MKNKLFQEVLEQAPEHSRVFVQLYTDIIDRIYDIMEEKGLKQKDIADALGKRESEISKWLKGQHNLTLRTIAKLQVALGEPILTIPQKEEKKQFMGWKKTRTKQMHVHVNRNFPEAATKEAQIIQTQSETEKLVAAS